MNLPSISNKSILISALDWGFGHTTRCVAIINELIKVNKITFAGNTTQINFIKKEFPTIKTVLIDGYNVLLSSKRSTTLQISKQSLKIYKSIQSENKWVNNYLKSHQIDLILSDNRYGFRNEKVESIFIGHQISIQTPFFKKRINSILQSYINQFSSCWIVDDKQIKLAGLLSNSDGLKTPYIYIGVLSRFQNEHIPIHYDVLIIVSGAYPENTIFLKITESHFKNSNKKIAIVSSVISENENSKFDYHYLPSTKDLNKLINQSDCVIAKAGYTTIMEMFDLNKQTYLIPTIGQYEQQYLSKHIKYEFFTFIDNISNIKI